MTALLASLLSIFGVSMTQPDMASITNTHENVSIAAQPSEADLDVWAANGTRVVVNTRSMQETAGLSFGMRAAVESRGMRYVEMPIGGPHGADPQHTIDLAALLADNDGPVVMHCRSGMRAAHLYGAHLISTDSRVADPFDTMSWTGPQSGDMLRALTPPASED
jgi:uncharacterized protein (TIGR01244 family)